MTADRWLGLMVLAAALVIFVLVAAAESAVASANRTRLRHAGERGSSRALRLFDYANERASVLAVLALVRTFAAVSATAVAAYIAWRTVDDSWSAVAAVALVAALVLAVLDGTVRLLIVRAPEAWGMRLLVVLGLCRMVFGPFSWAIDRTLRTVVGQPGAEPEDETEELLRLADIETNGDGIEEDERQMIEGIISLDETTAREIMAPRIDIAAVDVSETIDDALKLIVERGFSRIPLYDETIDNVTGIIYAKDLLRCLAESRRPSLREIARPAYFIPESKRVDELLAELRKSKVHIAIVVDEYGGTAGLVTIEDLIEEIVGEIQDEYDREEAPIERVSDAEAILDGRVSIDVIDELFGVEIDDEDFDTVGGFVYHQLGKVPVAGDEVRVDGLTLRVLSVLGRRIKKVRATRTTSHDQPAAAS